MSIESLIKDDCTACGACLNACNRAAISFAVDDDGFPYPVIDNTKCNDCNLCEKSCPILTPPFYGGELHSGFIASGKDEKLIQPSASGGAFAVLAKYVIEKQGTVFGACCDEDFVIRHHGTNDDITPMQGSKYVQSTTNDCFRQVRNLLKREKHVLFSGTPCQIAGLHSFLNKDYANLITVDIICHGVSSPLAFRNYIEYLEKKYHNKVISYRFRNRSKFDENGFISKTMLSNGRCISKDKDADIYFTAYLNGMLFRESCYRCRFANTARKSDFTLGDCGTRRSYNGFNAGKPVSVIFPNTEKALNIWNDINDQFNYLEIDVEKEISKNKQLNRPSHRSKMREMVCQYFAHCEFAKIESILKVNSIKQRFVITYRSLIPWKIRSTISLNLKKLLGRNQ